MKETVWHYDKLERGVKDKLDDKLERDVKDKLDDIWKLDFVWLWKVLFWEKKIEVKASIYLLY